MHLSNDTNVPNTHIGVLGSLILLYFVASKVGWLNIVCPNSMELHNLHCQVVYSKAFVGEEKVKFATTCFFFLLFQKQISNLVTQQFTKSTRLGASQLEPNQARMIQGLGSSLHKTFQ
jgi:molybdopterin/thiamine biosynthesis adenylyltransferase